MWVCDALAGCGSIGSCPAEDTRLITHLSRAHDWLARLATGKARSVGEIALGENLSPSHITRMLYRACLAPDIVRAILNGAHPPGFTSETLKRNLPLPIDWQEQRKLFGFPSI